MSKDVKDTEAQEELKDKCKRRGCKRRERNQRKTRQSEKRR